MGTAVSRKTLSPQTIGDADPRPGISTFQRMFCVSLHSVGGLPCRATPFASGPRHCPQKRSASESCATAGMAQARARHDTPIVVNRPLIECSPKKIPSAYYAVGAESFTRPLWSVS